MIRNVRILPNKGYNTLADNDTSLNIRCAYKDCPCSPECAALEITGTSEKYTCNRGQFEIGYKVAVPAPVSIG
jgi:hypothetical protein